MKYLYLIIASLLFTSCNTGSLKNSSENDSTTDPSTGVLNFNIDTLETHPINLPFGYSKIGELKLTKDTIYNVYKEASDKTSENINKLSFKNNIVDYKPLMDFIQKSSDSLDVALHNDYFANEKKEKKIKWAQHSISVGSKMKILFLKTEYFRTFDNKKDIENLYLVSTKDGKIIDILNIYYHYVKTHSMGSRFFSIDKNLQIASAVYLNVEGEVSISNYQEFELSDNGFFKVKN